MIYLLCFLIILIGIYGILTRVNLIKIVISLLVIEYGVHLLLAISGYRRDGVPPIVDQTSESSRWLEQAVDPVPQALVLTSIVIGLGVLALMVALSIRIHEKYGTTDIRKIRRLKG